MTIIYLAVFFILFNLYIYISIYMHEIGHYISAKLLGAKNTKIIILGSRKEKPTTSFSFGRKMSKIEDFVITVSGVFMQLLLTMFLLIQDFSLFLKIISIVYIPGIFINILPLKPLDGFYLILLFERDKIVAIIFYSIFLLSIFLSLFFSWKFVLILSKDSLFDAMILMSLPTLFLYIQARKINGYRRLNNENIR